MKIKDKIYSREDNRVTSTSCAIDQCAEWIVGSDIALTAVARIDHWFGVVHRLRGGGAGVPWWVSGYRVTVWHHTTRIILIRNQSAVVGDLVELRTSVDEIKQCVKFTKGKSLRIWKINSHFKINIS
jgi:hypothetical protein